MTPRRRTAGGRCRRRLAGTMLRGRRTCLNLGMRRDERPLMTLIRDVREAIERATAARSPATRRRGGAIRAPGWLDEPDSGVPLRGEVWLAETEPGGRAVPVVLLQPDTDASAADSVVVARVDRGGGAGVHRVRVAEADGLPAGCSVNAGRITTVDSTALLRRIATLTPATMAEVDAAVAAVLGLEPGTSKPAAPLAGDPAPPVAPARRSPPPQTEGWPEARPSSRLEDHPMARMFGQSPPPLPVAPAVAGAEPDVAALLPELRAVVQRRLHRSSPRLELILDDAAADGHSVEWAAAAVRA